MKGIPYRSPRTLLHLLLPLTVSLALLGGWGQGASQSPAGPGSGSAPVPIRHRIADCHLHLVDFLQSGDDLPALLKAMDGAGVDYTMVCGLPLQGLQRKTTACPSGVQRRKWTDTPTWVKGRAPEPSAFMTHTSSRPP